MWSFALRHQKSLACRATSASAKLLVSLHFSVEYRQDADDRSGGELVAPVGRLAAVVLGEQHAERLVSLRDDAHQTTVALRQRRPSPPERLSATAAVARRQHEIVQDRLAPVSRRRLRDAVVVGEYSSAAAAAQDRLRLGGDAERARGHVVVAVAVTRVRLARVEVVEVGDDDRNRKRDGEDAGDGAHGADEPAPRAHRRHVAVADRRHRHHRPPERVRYAAARTHARGLTNASV